MSKLIYERESYIIRLGFLVNFGTENGVEIIRRVYGE